MTLATINTSYAPEQPPAPTDVDRTPPCDPEAEKAILGALMWDIRVLPEVADLIAGPDFYQPAHEHVYQAITHLADTGRPVDPITVADELTQRGHLQAIGGSVGLADMYGAVTVAANAPAHARIVHDRAVQRRTLTAAQRIHQLATVTTDPAELIEAAQATLDQLDPGTRTTTQTVASTLGPLVDRIGKDDTLAGLASPWPDLNRYLPGWQAGRLHIIGARPSVGKSLTAQALAEHWAAHHGLDVYLATCEMSADELTMRMLSRQSRVPLSTLTDGRHLTDRHWGQIATATARMADTHARIEICDDPSQTVASIRAGARLMHRKGNLGLVVVDYLQLLAASSGGRRDRNREQEVAEMSRGLKRLAMELHVPVVAVSQLNRQMTTRADKRPTLSDLRESGAVEQDADVVLLLHQPDAEAPHDLEAILAKNRGGPVGSVRLIQQGWIANIASVTGGAPAGTSGAA